jgi:hypothetical protein
MLYPYFTHDLTSSEKKVPYIVPWDILDLIGVICWFLDWGISTGIHRLWFC